MNNNFGQFTEKICIYKCFFSIIFKHCKNLFTISTIIEDIKIIYILMVR